jgi:hypothetical protein
MRMKSTAEVVPVSGLILAFGFRKGDEFSQTRWRFGNS